MIFPRRIVFGSESSCIIKISQYPEGLHSGYGCGIDAAQLASPYPIKPLQSSVIVGARCSFSRGNSLWLLE